jgi:hypothetical protein
LAVVGVAVLQAFDYQLSVIHVGVKGRPCFAYRAIASDQEGAQQMPFIRVFELDRARYTDALRCVTAREKAQWPLENKDGQLIVINQLHNAACRCAGYAGAGPKILICDDRE